MTLFVGETGKTLRVNAGFDLSSNTEISLVFTSPTGTATTKNSADGVSVGSSDITDPDLGALTASYYVEYPIEAGLLSAAGRWCVQVKYTNTGVSPTDLFYGNIAHFTVKERCDS